MNQSNLSDFYEYLDAQNIARRPGKGQWQAQQVYYDGAWCVLHLNSSNPEVKVPEKLFPVLRAYESAERAPLAEDPCSWTVKIIDENTAVTTPIKSKIPVLDAVNLNSNKNRQVFIACTASFTCAFDLKEGQVLSDAELRRLAAKQISDKLLAADDFDLAHVLELK